MQRTEHGARAAYRAALSLGFLGAVDRTGFFPLSYHALSYHADTKGRTELPFRLAFLAWLIGSAIHGCSNAPEKPMVMRGEAVTL